MEKGYILSDLNVLFGKQTDVVGFGLESFYVKEISRELANQTIVENHYSKKHDSIPHNRINLGVYKDGKFKGVLQFGYAMNPASCIKVVANTKIQDYLELNRMWLHDDCPKNSESRAISFSIKYIKRKYPNISWIQSFADERCKKNGIVYQAANFGYYGGHTSTFWEIDGEFYHNSIVTNGARAKATQLKDKLGDAIKHELKQFRYLYFIHRKLEKDCLLKKQDYPKHYID